MNNPNTHSRIAAGLGTVALTIAGAALAQSREGCCTDDAIARIQQLPAPALKAFYLDCARAAHRRVLASSDVALCSVGYEALLIREFKGDFNALLAWSRAHPDDSVHSEHGRTEPLAQAR